MKKSVIALVLIAIIGGAGLYGYQSFVNKTKKAQELVRKPVSIEADRARKGVLSSKIKVAGLLKANESVVLKSETEGRVEKVFFEGGSYVEKGEIILELDDSLYKAQLNEAQAQYNASKEALSRFKELYSKQIATKKDYEKAVSDEQTAKSRLEIAKTKLAQTKIRAPFEGFLGLRDVSPGAVLKPGQELMTLEDLDPLKVEFKVPETYATEVKVDQKVEVRIGNNEEKSIQAEISSVDTKVDPIGHNLTVRATLSNRDGSLKSGQFVSVFIDVGDAGEAVIVPDAAIESIGKEDFIYVVVDNVVRKINVKVGRREGGRVEILSGIKHGDLVVTAGHMKIADGSEVVVVSK